MNSMEERHRRRSGAVVGGGPLGVGLGVLLMLTLLLSGVASGQDVEDPPEVPAEEGPAIEQMVPDESGGGSGVRRPEGPAGTSPDYLLRLRELEDRVNELKEEIFRAKSRLVLLRERVLQASLGGTRAIITHIDEMSATFNLVQVIYSLDGTQIYSALDEDGSLSDRDRIEIYNGAIVPGPHNISVEMIYVGSGFGIFNYLEGYRFRLRSSYAFTAEEGRLLRLDVVAHERGGVNQPIEERPDIRFEVEYADSAFDDVAAGESAEP